MDGSIAHKCTGSHQFVLLIDMHLANVLIHVSAAQFRHGFRHLSVRPPATERERERMVKNDGSNATIS